MVIFIKAEETLITPYSRRVAPPALEGGEATWLIPPTLLKRRTDSNYSLVSVRRMFVDRNRPS